MPILTTILVSALIGLSSFVGAYKYMPLSWLDSAQKPTFGSTITTINGSDTLSASRSVINTNFSNLNTDKIEATQTTLNSLTSASSLATVGTITSGTWSGTAIAVAKGGTGTTSPTSNQIMIGNGASGLKVIGFGTTGQFLTSQGDATAPQWATSVIDESLNYNFTGTTFNVKNLNASSTSANPIKLNGISYSLPSTQGASSTALLNNASGALEWNTLDWQQVAETVLTGAAGTTTISVPSRKDYMISVFATSTTNSGFAMQMNGLTGAVYDYSRIWDGVQSGATNKTGINMADISGSAIGTQKFGTIRVLGSPLGAAKFVTWELISTSLAGSAPVISTGGGNIHNTGTAITSFSFGGQGVNFESGTRFTIYASAI